ncbi:MAG: pyrimidine 5'-nucleotidase [Pseudomonadota bacterium]
MIPSRGLAHVDTWVFDLDNTLYPADAEVMSQVDKRMTQFVMQLLDLEHDAARSVQKRYWHDYGTTLNGLMSNHDVDLHAFLDFVHDIDHDVLAPDPVLAQHISQLEGRRLVYTNGSMKHAERVIDRLGLNGQFHDLFDIAAADFTPKPQRAAFDRFTGHFGITPNGAAMFEDSARNLETAAAMGFTTVLVRAPIHIPEGESAGPGEEPDHVHYVADCLKTFLGEVVSPPTAHTDADASSATDTSDEIR